jgi:hypothetical protein
MSNPLLRSTKLKRSKKTASVSSQGDDKGILEDKLKQCGAMCKKYIQDSDNTLLCDCCKYNYHLKCTNFNEEVYQLMKVKNCFADVSWKCNKCKNENPIANSELLEMLKALQQRVTLLETNGGKQTGIPIPKQNRNIPETKVENKITHQLIVSTDGNEPLTQKSFADKVKCNLRTVPIKNLKIAKDGCGIIEFPDQTSRDDGLAKLKEDFNVQPNNKPQRFLLPKITISGIESSDYKASDVLKLQDAICDKNPSIKQLIEQGGTFEILFIKEDWQKKNFSVAVAKISKEIYSEIRRLKYQLYIDFIRCRVSDRFHLPQCYGCQKFGHTSNNCQIKSNDLLVCRYCAKNHQSKSCPHKGHVDMYKCANCGLNHTSTYIKCPVVQNQLQSLLNRTQGVECLSKNDIRPHVLVT